MARVGIAVGVIGSTARAALWVALAVLTIGVAVATTRQAFAQDADADAAPVLSQDELAELIGPIALYPDDLVAIVLPASTYPLQVVEASRFLERREQDPRLKPDEEWDDSVVALLNYPDVIKLMNDDLDWTWRLGDAVIAQRADVLDAIQTFRDRAYAAGNLRSDDRQVVERDDGSISIKPANPEVIYVPYYEPERVVVYQTSPVYHYYPIGYPVYYYPYPIGYPFHVSSFWGVTSWFTIGWHTHFVHVHHHDYWGHPYHGHVYNAPFFVRRDTNLAVSRGSYVWEPRYRPGAQPHRHSDGRRYVDVRGAQRQQAQQGGSYRNGGATARSSGQQTNQPLDRNAAANRDRAARAGQGGTYRSNGANGGSATAPSGRQTNQPIRERANDERRDGAAAPPVAQRTAPERYRAAPQPDDTQQRTTPQTDAQRQVRRAPDASDRATPAPRQGQYRSGGGMSQAQRERAVPQRSNVAPQRQGAAPQARVVPPPAARAPSVRVAPPPAARAPAAESRANAGRAESRSYRSTVPQRSSEAFSAPREQSSRGGYSGGGNGGGGRAAPSHRGGGRQSGQPMRRSAER